MYAYISEENLIELEKFNAWKKQQAINEIFSTLGAMIRPAYQAATAIRQVGSGIASGARAVGSAVAKPVRGAISVGRTAKNIGAGLIDPAKQAIGAVGSAFSDVPKIEKGREQTRVLANQMIASRGLRGNAATATREMPNIYANKAYGALGDRLRQRIVGSLDQAKQNISAAIGPAKPGAGLLSRVARSAGGALYDTARERLSTPIKTNTGTSNRRYGQPVGSGGIFSKENQKLFVSNFAKRFAAQPEE
jgi:hypothetical protein